MFGWVNIAAVQGRVSRCAIARSANRAALEPAPQSAPPERAAVTALAYGLKGLNPVALIRIA